MNHTIFSRGTRNQMEGWNQVPIGDSQWIYMMRKTQMKQEDNGTLIVRYQPDPYSSRTHELFRLSKDVCDKYKSRVASLDYITGAPRHLAFYLTLVEQGMLDTFINKYMEARNAVTQSA